MNPVDRYTYNIHHAGGGYDGKTYTNSKEALLASKYHTIEVDVVNIKDSCVIAHDYCEKKFYNYDGQFKDLMYRDYKELKVYDKYTPMDFHMLREIMDSNPTVSFVLDVKGNEEEYKYSLEFIKDVVDNHIDRLIPQIYNFSDFQLCKSMGFTRCLFATYKIIFAKPKEIITSDKVLNVLTQIDAHLDGVELFGISIHIDYYKTKELKEFEKHMENMNRAKHTNHKIYFHGQTAQSETGLVEELNNSGYGLFIHDV